MTFTPGQRKLVLTVHVVASVGWLGAVVAFIALAVAGLASDDSGLVRGAYLAMEATGWFVLVPLSVASLLTGVVQSLGSKWGLVRYYWVVGKLLINVSATVVLVMYMQTLGDLADIASATSGSTFHGLRSPTALVHSVIALLLLIAATVLAVYKPPGLTRYGQRKQQHPAAL